MKTINQIKDCQAIDLGYNSFSDLVLNPKKDMKMNHINWCIERSMEEYASQFKPKWIEFLDSKMSSHQKQEFNKTKGCNLVLRFDTGEHRIFEEKYPNSEITHYFILPE